jgi:hypothetical protein
MDRLFTVKLSLSSSSGGAQDFMSEHLGTIVSVGVWGTKLFSSDIALDVRDHYRELIEDGVDDDEAARHTLGKYQSLFDDPEDGVTALLAFAVTQSKIGRLDPEIRDRAVAAIDQGGDLPIWEQEEPKLVPQRKAELARVRAQLTGPQPSRKRLKRPKLIQCGLWSGDVLAFQLPNASVLVRVVRVQSYRKFELPILEELEYKGATLPSAEVLPNLPPRARENCLSLVLRSLEDTWFNVFEPGSDWAGAGFQRIGTTGDRVGDSHPRQAAYGIRSWFALADRYRSFPGAG